MAQAQTIHELEIGPQFVSLGNSTIQTRNIELVRIDPHPQTFKTQTEWDHKEKIESEKTINRLNEQIIECEKETNETSVLVADQRKISVLFLIFLFSLIPTLFLGSAVEYFGKTFAFIIFVLPSILLILYICKRAASFSHEARAYSASSYKNWVTKRSTKDLSYNFHMLSAQLKYLREEKSKNTKLLEKGSLNSRPFSLILKTNSGSEFIIAGINLDDAFALKRRFDAALGGSDLTVYHFDSRTQNVQMMVNANIKIEINNDIDHIMSRLDQLRAEDRAELKAYLDEVRQIANRNAISKEEAKETQSKLDTFLDKYRKIVGAANDTVELVNNIKKALNPFW